jgi:hypothetical protein
MPQVRPILPLTGGCSCGAIRYQITSFPLLLYTCHCADCQTTSGSAFALNMPVATSGFRINKGEPKGWRRKSPSGADVTSWFCSECGARVYGERDSRPDSVNVRAGTLDVTSWLIPVAHMFRRSAQSWVVLPDAECHETMPGDYRPLGAKWRALWPEFFPQPK